MASTAFLVDTNVLSELARPRPNDRVVAWAHTVEASAASRSLAWRVPPAAPPAILAPMHDDDLRAYAHRPWQVAEALKQEHWARELSTNPLATFEASQALWVHMRQVNPDWPTEAERREDLAHHIALKRAIDRAAGVFLATAGR